MQTRGLVVGGGAEPRARRTVLAPVADLLNYSPTSPLAWPSLEAAGAARPTGPVAEGPPSATLALTFRLLSAVPAGRQLCLYYGHPLAARESRARGPFLGPSPRLLGAFL